MKRPLALSLYRAGAGALAPALTAWLKMRTQIGKEDAQRIGERYGRTEIARPPGRLVWLHGASVGEMGVVLQLQHGLALRDPELSFLVTTGTRTSADLFKTRAPKALHQYAPLDRVACVQRFLAHWRPDLGVFVESELWPNLALEARAMGVPLALVNARMSEASLGRWRRMRASIRHLLECFDPILAADARTADGLSDLAGRDVPGIGNLKLAAAAPHVDEAALAALREAIGERPVWLAASTHEGEEDIVAGVHSRLRTRHPNALLIIAPRHPERGASVAQIAERAPRRSLGQPIGAAPFYVADTIGELGMFYRLAPVSVVCGSLQPGLRGHNPIEPAKLGSAIITGPHVESFSDLYDALAQADAAVTVETPQDLEAAVARLWADEAARTRLTVAALKAADAGAPALAATLDALSARLGVAHAPTQASA
ncbi:MAG: 3-deoxy-D-manno-octulosonic acid transferase [Alphaproteobacteria bacterium]|nr:3-deoxy-D-manno-octulosonic acid transferase [Alphaproteobacteria bacterium]